MKNTKLHRIKETLKSVLSQFQSERITSDKGILDVQKAGDEIAVGDTVVGVDEDGNEVQVESGEYILTDGTILKVADGRVAEIVVPEIEAPAEEPAQEEEKPAEEEAPEEEEEKPAEEPNEEEAPAEEEKPAEDEEKPAEEPEQEPDPVDEKVDDEIGTDTPEDRQEEPAEEEAPAEEPENEEVARLRAEIAMKDARIAELEAEIEKLKKEPAANPATEEFKAVNKIRKTGSEKLDRLAKIMGA